MTIKEGYDGKETSLRLISDTDRIQLWIEQEGLSDKHGCSTETLSYLTVEEALALKDEINQVLRERLGL